MRRLLPLLLLVPLAAACAPRFHPVPAPPPPLLLDENSSGQRFDVVVGQEALVALPSNPTTGYRWALAGAQSAVMAVVGEPDYTPPARLLPGAPGVETFRLKAMALGDAALTFEYRRAWEKGVPAARAVTITFLCR